MGEMIKMDQKFKKTAAANALLVAGLLGAGSLHAAAYTPPPVPACTPGSVTVPCEAEAWDLGVELMGVQQASGTNWYVHVANSVDKDNNNIVDTQFNELKPGYAFGFRLEGTYHFGTGSDFNVNWTYFKRSRDKNFGAGLSQYIPFAANNGQWDNVNVWAKTTFNQVNFEFGQTVDFGENVDLRFHSGLAYANLKHEMKVTGTLAKAEGEPGRELNSAIGSTSSRFSGFGPRFGQDLSYDFGNGFSVFGKYAVSALVGNLKGDQVETVYGPNDENPPKVELKSKETARTSQRAIIAGLETAAGAQYSWEMNDSGMLDIYAAWRANVYQSVVQQGRGNNNWGYHGPVIGFKWVGNV